MGGWVGQFDGRVCVARRSWGVIWPNTISKIAGYKYKALLSAVMGQIGTVMGYS